MVLKLDLLQKRRELSNQDIEIKEEFNRSNDLLSALNGCDIQGNIVGYHIGPIVSVYEFKPETYNDRVLSNINRSNEAIAAALAVESINIYRHLDLICFEIPNKSRSVIGMGYASLHASLDYQKQELPWLLGTDIYGNVICADLAKMPHLLIAGQTGSGKSVAVNAALINLMVMKEETKFLLIDPKVVEFSLYRGCGNLLHEPVTDPLMAANTLDSLVDLMEKRYQELSKYQVQNISDYNKKIGKMSRIVCVIDEFSDLMVVARKQVENSIVRIAQKARAVGIHLVVCTQRPDANTVTPLIKANLPAKIAYKVNGGNNSRIVIDQTGAEKLVGNGDGLFVDSNTSIPKRIHAPFAQNEDIKMITELFKNVEPVIIPSPPVEVKKETPKKIEYTDMLLFKNEYESFRRSKRMNPFYIIPRFSVWLVKNKNFTINEASNIERMVG